MGIKGRFPSKAPWVTTLLFDLDGTLVDMDRARLELRLILRAAWRFSKAIRPWHFRKAFWGAAEKMQDHGTEETNYSVFLSALSQYSARTASELDGIVRECLAKDFARLSYLFTPVPGARETLDLARKLGYRVVLATNPVWPLVGVEMRLKWGGLGDFPFDYVTHSEIMTRCKPHAAYYSDLLARLQVTPRECVMIGNDPRKDLPAHDVGIMTFLVERAGQEELMSQAALDPRQGGRGSFEDFREFIRRSKEEPWEQSQSSSV
ncbi:MAG: HAD family hydrolase [Deltaproteobacteria bacterium]|nr:HAD family hydrolase [Deltaproteobacteria bacterium]